MNDIKEKTLSRLKPIVGLKLSIARRAADMCNFQFGAIRIVKGGTVGEYALHIQCPWRIEDSQEILTGRSDLWEPIEKVDGLDWDSWDYDKSGNLQDKKIGALLGGYDPQTRSYVNEREYLVVEDINADDYGGATLFLSGGFRLTLFPAGSSGEDWRIFRPEYNEPHFVIVGGKIEY